MTIRIKQVGANFVYETGPLVGSPVAVGGSGGDVQYNDGGIFGGESTFNYNKSSNTLTVSYLSASLTRTPSGVSLLAAGNNITITSASSGQITIASTAGGAPTNAQYLVLTSDATLTNERVFTVGTGLTGLDSVGLYTLSINDSIVATVSGSTFTGATNFNQGLSGSLTKLTNGTSYLVAGNNVSIASSSNGQVVISSTASGLPAGSDMQLQFNDGGAFGADSNLSFEKNSNYLMVTGSLSNGLTANATANYSHAEGTGTTASNVYSHAEGYYTTASGQQAHAEGQSTVASGNGSHSEGYTSQATGVLSHAEGYSTIASGQAAHAEGRGDGSNANAVGDWSHTEGYYAKATGNYSHAEGNQTQATNDYSHAEGSSTIASGPSAHAEGNGTTASGNYSHAEGEYCLAKGYAAHAAGFSTTAHGQFSHAGGNGTIASGSYQTAIGQYNKRENDFSLFVIGDGTGDLNRGDILRVNSGPSVGNGAVQITGSLGMVGNIVPDADVTYTLGTSDKRWGHVYTGDLHLRNDRGDWTIVEERDYLCVVNNITGKKYKMMLQPIE